MQEVANALVKILLRSRLPGSAQSIAYELYPGDEPIAAPHLTANVYNSEWKTGVIGTSSMGHQFFSFESAGSSPRRILYTFDLPKNEKDRRALKLVVAEGGVDLKNIKKKVLGKFEAYWSTASKRMVSQPAEM